MIVPIDQIKKIVSLGGGVRLDLSKQIITINDILHLATLAGESGASLFIRFGTYDLTMDQIFQVAASGRGKVIFEDLLD